MTGASKPPSPSDHSSEPLLVWVERLRDQAEAFQQTIDDESRALIEALYENRTMKDEWTRLIADGRLVKFTYEELPDGQAFLTAQIGGRDVVYSIILDHPEYPFHREAMERHFDAECPPISQ